MVTVPASSDGTGNEGNGEREGGQGGLVARRPAYSSGEPIRPDTLKR